MQTKILKMGLILAVFCAIAAGLLAYVYLFTKPTIDLQDKLAFENSMKEVSPGADSFKEISAGGGSIYKASKNGQEFGFAVSVSPRGYAGEIKMLVGVDLDGKIIGVKIIDQRETAGLGANVAKPAFIKQFLGKTIKDPLEPKKDINAITGATISSRAVCRGVRDALERF